MSAPSSPLNIAIVGIGGAGIQIVTKLLDGIADESFGSKARIRRLGIDTSAVEPEQQSSIPQIRIGADREFVGPWWPDTVRIHAWQQREQIRQALKGCHWVMIVAGLGGATGSGATHVVARLAREAGALTMVFAMTPAGFEKRRPGDISTAMVRIRRHCDSLILHPHQSAAEFCGESADYGLNEIFSHAARAIRRGILGLIGALPPLQLVGLDFEDIRTAFGRGESALGHLCRYSHGVAAGEWRGAMASHRALVANPEMGRINQAYAVFAFATANPKSLRMRDVNEVMNRIKTHVREYSHVLFGAFHAALPPDEEMHVGLFCVLQAADPRISSAN